MTPQKQLEKDQLTANMIRPGQSPESQKIANEALESQKAIIDAQIDTAKAQADTYNETLDSIQGVEEDINKKGFAGLLEKLKGTVSWIGEKTYNGLGIKNASETQKTLGGVAVGAGILAAGYFGIKKLWKGFSEDNKEENKESNQDEKKESKEGILKSIGGSIRGLVKRVALWGGIGLAASYLASYFLKGKSLNELIDQFLVKIGWKKKKDGLASTTDASETDAVSDSETSLQKEKNEVQNSYNQIGDDVNNLFATTGVQGQVLLGQSQLEELDQNSGVIPYMLDGRYSTLGDFVGEGGIYTESFDINLGKKKEWFLDLVKNKSLEFIKSFFGGFPMLFQDTTKESIKTATTKEGLLSLLENDKSYDTVLNYAYQKSMMTLSYLQNRRTALENRLRQEGKSQSDIDAIVKDVFLSQKICNFNEQGELVSGFYKYLRDNNLNTIQEEDISEDIKEQVNDSNKEKETFQSRVKSLQESKNKNTLTNEQVKQFSDDLGKYCDDLEDKLGGFTVLPILKLIGGDRDAEKLYNNGPLKAKVDHLKKVLQEVSNKGSNIALEDLNQINTQVEELFELEKVLLQSSWEMEQSRDQNGNPIIRHILRPAGAFASSMKETSLYGYEMVMSENDREKIKGGIALGGVAVSIYPFVRPASTLKFVYKTSAKIVCTIPKGARLLKGSLGYGSVQYYTTTHGMDFVKDVLHGKISPERALRIANAKGIAGSGISFRTYDEVIKHLLDKQGLSDKQMKFIIDNMDELRKNKKLSKLLFQNGDNLSHTLWQRIKISGRSMFKDNTSLKVSLQHLDELIKLNPSGKITNIGSILGETVEVLDNKIGTITNEISKSTEFLTNETKKIFQNFDKEVAKEAKKLKIAQGTQEYLELSKKIWEKPQYGKNKKLLDMIAKHNEDIAKHEKHILQLFNKASRKEKQLLCKNSLIKKIVDANGGIESRRILGGKARMISIGIHAVTLGWMGSNKDINGNKKSGKDIAIDAADFGASMIPVAGGAYDVYRAIRGTDLAGNNLSTTERRVRGGIGLVSIPLDIISFGAGGSLLKGGVKGGSKVLLKAGAKELAEEGAEIAIKQSTKKLILTNIAKGAARDILLGTVAGVALVPIIGHFKQEPLGDESEK